MFGTASHDTRRFGWPWAWWELGVLPNLHTGSDREWLHGIDVSDLVGREERRLHVLLVSVALAGCFT